MNWTMQHFNPRPAARTINPIEAVVFPLPSPVFTIKRPFVFSR
jgi:hypothetical protein